MGPRRGRCCAAVSWRRCAAACATARSRAKRTRVSASATRDPATSATKSSPKVSITSSFNRLQKKEKDLKSVDTCKNKVSLKVPLPFSLLLPRGEVPVGGVYGRVGRAPRLVVRSRVRPRAGVRRARVHAPLPRAALRALRVATRQCAHLPLWKAPVSSVYIHC